MKIKPVSELDSVSASKQKVAEGSSRAQVIYYTRAKIMKAT